MFCARETNEEKVCLPPGKVPIHHILTAALVWQLRGVAALV